MEVLRDTTNGILDPTRSPDQDYPNQSLWLNMIQGSGYGIAEHICSLPTKINTSDDTQR